MTDNHQKNLSDQNQFLTALTKSKMLNISARTTNQGPTLDINHHQFYLRYPRSIWEKYPQPQRQVLSENLAYALTFFLPYLLWPIETINYALPTPISEAFFLKGLIYSLPSIALMEEKENLKSTTRLLRRLLNINYQFTGEKTRIPPLRRRSNKNKVIVPFSFGKDSLLTLALCQELGLTPYPVYIAEPDYRYEFKIKKKLAMEFKKETGFQVEFFQNNYGIFREHNGYLGWELQLTHYALMLLPYVFAHNAGFILYANEQSCNDLAIDNEGFTYNPVFEQSRNWLLQVSLIASLVGGNALTISSLIEPIYEIAVVYILHHRYPQFGRFQTSCDPEDKESRQLHNRRWCENCSKCGRIFMFLLANGVDPKKVGFTKWLLAEKYQSLYPILDEKSDKSYGYDQSAAGKEEQLFAFYLAYKNGFKGPLMDKFAKKYLETVKSREKEYRQKFYGLHSDLTMPSVFRKKLFKIFHQELDGLR